MIRKIIHIDQDKCNGCGICAKACHEGAIEVIDGKARLLRENFCDGFGDCLPGCPTGAIPFEEREAAAYDAAAVKAAKETKTPARAAKSAICPGTGKRQLQPEATPIMILSAEAPAIPATKPVTQLQNWPVQIKLAPVKAPYFDSAELLIAADCTAFAYGDFHNQFMTGKVTLIGCPKLDAVDYSEKLTEILANNNIQGLTVLRMDVPCCGGLERAAKKALQASGKLIPWQVVTLSTDGKVLD
ncbi:MAG: 4Fe-4S binding protein [Oscillospiraceae bacterium]|nr:4Fe-4S binding protein [Oscillospiraceae bacterium]